MKFAKKEVLAPDFPIEYQKYFIKFLNCKINLENQVFIPRPETEFWVKKAIKEVRMLECLNVGMLKILDIFAGSGCIGIAILKNIKNSCLDFADIDERAISQIKINLKLNNISKGRYKIYQSDLFKKLKDKKYDYIFANPPYVAKERLSEVQPSVLKYEPKRAILADKGGLFYIKKFLKEAKNFLKQNGVIYLEIDPQQKDDIKNILEKQRYKKSKFFKDQFQEHRFLKISLAENSSPLFFATDLCQLNAHN